MRKIEAIRDRNDNDGMRQAQWPGGDNVLVTRGSYGRFCANICPSTPPRFDIDQIALASGGWLMELGMLLPLIVLMPIQSATHVIREMDLAAVQKNLAALPALLTTNPRAG